MKKFKLILAILGIILIGIIIYKLVINKETDKTKPKPNATTPTTINKEPLWGQEVTDTIKPELKAAREKAAVEYGKVMEAAMKAKAKGDAGDKASYEEAIKLFKQASEIGENKFWIPLSNIGNVYKAMGDYKNAEDYYNQAIKVSKNAEPAVYLQKIELYRDYLKKPANEVKALYEEAISKLVENANIVMSYAEYANKIGDYKTALKWYQVLADKYKDNKFYAQMVKELKGKAK